MKGINLDMARKFATRDVIIDEKIAKTVIKLLPDNKALIHENDNPRLDIIAIIGPAENFALGHFRGEKTELSEVVLAEIGISRGRPYHQANGTNRNSDEGRIHRRKKYFSLTIEQYSALAPYLFSHIAELALRKVAGWKNSTYVLPHAKCFYAFCRKKTIHNDSFGEFPKGTRFTFSVFDRLLVQDIIWAETNLNGQLRGEMAGLANFIDKRLAPYRRSKRYKGKWRIEKLAGMREIKEMVLNKCWPTYIRRNLFEQLAARRKKFYQPLKELFLSGYEEKADLETPWLIEADKTCPRERLNDIRLRITTSLVAQKDYIVAEVYPDLGKVEARRSANVQVEVKPAELADVCDLPDNGLEDLPF